MAPKTSKRKVLTEREQIGERLKMARIDMGLTQMELAEKADVGRSTIMHYENAKAAPGAMELLRLARALEISPNYILSGKERFGKQSDEDVSLDTESQTKTIMRLTLCLTVLEPEVRDSFMELLMSMAKARIGKIEFKQFMAMLDTLPDSAIGLAPEIESLVDQHIAEGRFANVEEAIEATGKGK